MEIFYLIIRIICILALFYMLISFLRNYYAIRVKQVKFTYLTDPETKVQYIISSTGGICPRLYPDGTIVIEEDFYDD